MQAKANRAEISISPRLRLLEERTKRESMDGVIATSRIEVKLAHNGPRHEPGIFFRAEDRFYPW
ncbi:MAG: hypothetical protein DMG95_13035 [Acidobacteria bacterium]|nr:MAG: hypothetical protein DMG94_10345 [Acidobacteriota bacterium]PYV61065.1 MAG: hypothetical protein DMG95_13035 [Acidobacteriota bacterium]